MLTNSLNTLERQLQWLEHLHANPRSFNVESPVFEPDNLRMWAKNLVMQDFTIAELESFILASDTPLREPIHNTLFNSLMISIDLFPEYRLKLVHRVAHYLHQPDGDIKALLDYCWREGSKDFNEQWSKAQQYGQSMMALVLLSRVHSESLNPLTRIVKMVTQTDTDAELTRRALRCIQGLGLAHMTRLMDIMFDGLKYGNKAFDDLSDDAFKVVSSVFDNHMRGHNLINGLTRNLARRVLLSDGDIISKSNHVDQYVDRILFIKQQHGYVNNSHQTISTAISETFSYLAGHDIESNTRANIMSRLDAVNRLIERMDEMVPNKKALLLQGIYICRRMALRQLPKPDIDDDMALAKASLMVINNDMGGMWVGQMLAHSILINTPAKDLVGILNKQDWAENAFMILKSDPKDLEFFPNHLLRRRLEDDLAM